jgi:hypothetical protein
MFLSVSNSIRILPYNGIIRPINEEKDMKCLQILIALALFVPPVVVAAQDECKTIVQTALEMTAENCSELGNGQACYGNVTIDADARPGVTAFQFEAAGDLANLVDIASMRLSSQVSETGEWGVSMMQVEAITLNGTTSAQLVIFGDVEIADPDATAPTQEVVIPTPTSVPVTVELTTTGNLNVRGGPSTNNAIVSSLIPGESVVADGRNAAGDWARFALPDGSHGWIYVPLVTAMDNVMALDVVDVTTGTGGQQEGERDPIPPPPDYAAMQAFTLQSVNGLADSPCESAPDSGLLIQTPEGEGRITLRINEVLIDLGSTAFVQAAPNDDMLINVLEGLAVVTVESTGVVDPTSGALGPVISTAIATEGMRVRIAMDGSLQPSSAPVVEPYEQARLLALPTALLAGDVQVVEAAAPFEGVIETGTWQRRGVYRHYPCGELEGPGLASEEVITAANLAGFVEELRTTRFANNYEDLGFGTVVTILQDEIIEPGTWLYHYNWWIPMLPGDLRPNYGTAHRWDFRTEFTFVSATRMLETITGIFNYCPGSAFGFEWTYVGG